MISGFDYTRANGLYVSVDWLSWTVLTVSDPLDVIHMMGYVTDDFQNLEHGRYGYAAQFRHHSLPVSVLYNGGPDMGIHVDVSGSAIQDVLQHYQLSHSVSTPFGTVAYELKDVNHTVLSDFLNEIFSSGHLTRLDLAVDDFGANYYSLDELHDIFYHDNFVSKFRKWKYHAEYEKGNVNLGSTIYLGSRKSDVMLRIYDKQKEQNQKRKNTNEPLLESLWVRWEFELKGDRAAAASQLLVHGQSVSDVCIGIMSNYLRIIERDNARKDRCSTAEIWQRFIDGIRGVSLYFAPAAKSIARIKNWLRKQVAPSLAVVVQSDGGCIDFLHELISSGVQRLTNQQLQLIYESLGVAS